MYETYKIIFSNFCDKELQNRLEHKENFIKEIENDPFKLLAAIKEMMHTTSHEKLIYPFETLWTSLAALFKLKQEKEEKLSDYYDKMKAFSVQVKKYLPDEVLHQFVEGLDMYQKEKSYPGKQKEMKKGAWNQLIALGFLYNSDCERYGKLLKDYQTDFADCTDNFPKDLVSMRERMSIACNEDKFLKKKNKDKDNKDKGKDTNSNENVTYASSFAQVAQGKKVCWVCGGDHLANVCPHRDKIPRDKWYKNTMESHHTFLKSAYVHYVKGDTTSLSNTENQTVVENQYQENENSGDTGQRVSWDSFPSHMQIVTSHAEKAVTCEQKTIILDSGSTMSIFHDKDLVYDIKKADYPIKIATNAGSRIVSKQAMVAGFGSVWYDEEAIANIFSIKDLKMQHHITYDSEVEDAFFVHKEDKEPVKFKCTSQGIYAYTIPVCREENMELAESHLVDTVKENRKGYTQAQFDRAVKARSLYHELGAPTLENYKGFIKMGGVQNCPIRIEDIKIAQNIFGPDMATLKGKSTRRKPKAVLEDWIELPKEILEKHSKIELCIDVMYINGVGLMTAIDRTIKY